MNTSCISRGLRSAGAIKETRTKSLSEADLKAISYRLFDVLSSCLATYHLAEIDSHDAEWALIAIQEMAKSNVKGIDACLEKLNAMPCAGNFRNELKYEEEAEAEE